MQRARLCVNCMKDLPLTTEFFVEKEKDVFTYTCNLCLRETGHNFCLHNTLTNYCTTCRGSSKERCITKKCPKCQKQFPLTKEFFANKNNQQYTSWCISCLQESGCTFCAHGVVEGSCNTCFSFTFGGTRVCSSCKQNHALNTEFFAQKKDGSYTARCLTCLEENGVVICVHRTIHSYCTICAILCAHKKNITDCKLCGDPIPITARQMVNSNLARDKTKGQFNKETCVDYQHVMELIRMAQGSCYYCNCSLQYQTYGDNLASLERLTNSLGHVKGNCVISCLKCNRSGVGEKIVRHPAPKPVFGPKRAPLIPAVTQSKTESPSVQPVKKKATAVPQRSREEGAPALPTKKRRRSQVEEIELFL